MNATIVVGFSNEVITNSAKLFASAEVMADDAIKSVCKELGTAPTFTLWGLISAAWRGAYLAARKCSEESAEKAWQRLAARALKDYGLGKPKAPSMAAGKMAAGRAKQEKAVKAAVVQFKTEAALNRQAGQALEAGKPEQADLYRSAAKVAAKAEKAVKAEAQKKRWEKVGAEIATAKKQHDERILKAIEDALKTLVPVKGTKAK
jgi:hypothetical protein